MVDLTDIQSQQQQSVFGLLSVVHAAMHTHRSSGLLMVYAVLTLAVWHDPHVS